MRIAIGSDHAGFRLKELVRERLLEAGHEPVDFGAPDERSVDYPDIAIPLAQAVRAGDPGLGIVICSNGVGVSIAANKVAGVRAGLCHDPWSARRARQHTNCNVLALGGLAIGREAAWEVVQAFINAEFEGGRHERRVAKLDGLDEAREGEPSASA